MGACWRRLFPVPPRHDFQTDTELGSGDFPHSIVTIRVPSDRVSSGAEQDL
jgi:hypothetical protein